MQIARIIWALFLTLLAGAEFGWAQEAVLPPGDTSPVLRLETGGPRSYVSGVAFSPDGRRLYATGWDKAIQVWERDAGGRFVDRPEATFRVPTGSGLYGGLNALALSEDGQWLAAAGQGHARDMSNERGTGWILPAGLLGEASQFDEGLIYVFHTETRRAVLLRGHRGPVQALTFVRGGHAAQPMLVSVAEERVEGSGSLQSKIRVWDVSRKSEIAKLEEVPDVDNKTWIPLPPLFGFRPGLTAWQAGPKPEQVRVALAWRDDRFRIWDTGTRQVSSVAADPNLLTVVPVPGQSRQFLTGGHGGVGVWSLPAEKAGSLPVLNRGDFAKAAIPSVIGQSGHLVSAAAWVPASGNRPPYLVLLVTRYLPDGRGEYRLVIASGNTPYRAVREIPLPWTGEIRQPSLSVSPDGQTVALAGSPGNEVSLHAVEALIQGQPAQPQILGSAGLSFATAEFVRNEDQWGLRLQTATSMEPAANVPKSLIVDFEARRVVPDAEGWHASSARAENWSIGPNATGGTKIGRPDGTSFPYRPGEDRAVTAFAVCPPSAVCPVPLVAIASHVKGQPRLEILRGDSGLPVRWCVGHTGRIRALSFSDDGRMLVSTAADRTVSVWTMADLKESTLDRHGQISSLELRDVAGRVVVEQEVAGLKANDEVQALIAEGQPTPISSPRQFYDRILARRPGTVADIIVKRGTQERTVQCPVEQAVDERKPLFSLFVAPGVKANEWQWIGWHPLGNFDAQGESVDRWLGWHFNTGEGEQPARFAAIGEYRDAFYRRGLLPTLIESQKLVIPAAQEDPKLSVRLRYRDGAAVESDVEGRARLNRPDVELVAEVTGVTERRIAKLEVSVNEAAGVPLTRDESGNWVADLSGQDWKRGAYAMVVRLGTPDQDVTRTQRAEFVPSPPTIELTPVGSEEIDAPTVLVKAGVRPSTEPLHVQLLRQKPGSTSPDVVREWKPEERPSIAEDVPLEPGDNVVEIRAWNAGAPDVDRERETVSRTFVVRRAAPAMAPRVAITEIVEIPYELSPRALLIDENVYRTVHPKVRIKGTVRSDRPIADARLKLGTTDRVLTNFQPDQSKEFAFEELVTLEPGPQSVTILAQVKDQIDEKRLAFLHELPPPLVTAFTTASVAVRPLPEGTRVDAEALYAGYHEPTVTATAVLQGQVDRPYKIVFRLNDRDLPGDGMQVDRSEVGEHRVTIPIPLAGGRNTLAVRVENEWTRQPTGAALMRELRRPPEILAIDAPALLEGQPLELTARIRSPLPVNEAWITIDDDHEVRRLPVRRADAEHEWTLASGKIGLAVGAHVIRVAARNDEGTALVWGTHEVTVRKPPEKAPVLTVATPPSSTNEQRIQIEYSVASAVPAELTLELRGSAEKSEIEKRTFAADEVQVDGSRQTLNVDLFEGANQLTITARNGGGFSERVVLQIAYTAPPATIELVTVGGLDPEQTRAYVGIIPEARTTLVGRVRVRDARDVQGKLYARVWINSYLLRSVELKADAADPRVKSFETDIVLNKALNRVRLEVFRIGGHLAAEVSSRVEYLAECREPEPKQDLYLLLLGTGDAEQLRMGALEALQAIPRSGIKDRREVWKSQAFTDVYVREMLNAPPTAVQDALRELVGQMRSSRSAPNSVVMVYYQGRITLIDDNRDFALGAVEPGQSAAQLITGRILQNNLLRSHGAHVIILDLNQQAEIPKDREIWPRAPHLGIAVSNWNGPGPQPVGSQFLSALKQTLPSTQVVGDLARRIDERDLAIQKDFPSQVEMLNMLDDIGDLRLGAVR